MRKLLSCIAAFSICLVAVSQTEVDRLVKDGIRLHDEARYDEALKKYDSALAIDKAHYLANYEKSYTLLILKKYDETIGISKFLLELDPNNINAHAVYINLGSAQDDKGDVEEAIKTFTKGIGLFPNSYLLHFNRGITYYKLERDKESMVDFQNALYQKPVHASSHQFLGRLMIDDNNRIAAILSLFTFLIMEPEGERAKPNYELLDKQIMKGISQDGKGATVIGIESLLPDKKNKKAENDFSALDLMLSLSAALDKDEKFRDQNAAEKLERKMSNLVSMFSEKEKGKGFFWDFYTPFLTEMKKKDHLVTACYLASIQSDTEQVNAWIDQNGTRIRGLYDWINEYKWNIK